MPYSPNFPKVMNLWVSDKMRADVDRIAKTERIPKTHVMRQAIENLVSDYDWGKPIFEHQMESKKLIDKDWSTT